MHNHRILLTFYLIVSIVAAVIDDRSSTNLTIVPTDFKPNVTEIVLSQNSITSVSTHAFSAYAPNLTVIRLDNNQVSSIDATAFDGLVYLVTLNLTANVLTVTIPGFHLPNLKELLLGANALTTLASGTLAALTSLKTLTLSKNVNFSWCDNMAELTEVAGTLVDLDLFGTDGNGSCVFDTSTFTSLNTLNASSCKLTIRIIGSSAATSSLTHLYLQDNHLSDSYVTHLNTLVHLQVLDLTYNSCTLFPDFSSSIRTSLTSILFLSNSISAVNSDFFTGMNNLEDLDLGNNHVPVFPSFPYLPKLKNAYFDNNNISSIPLNAFDNLPALAVLYLQNNPFHCGCDFQSVLDVVNNNMYSSLKAGVSLSLAPCASPSQYVNISYQNLPNFDCQTTVMTTQNGGSTPTTTGNNDTTNLYSPQVGGTTATTTVNNVTTYGNSPQVDNWIWFVVSISALVAILLALLLSCILYKLCCAAAAGGRRKRKSPRKLSVLALTQHDQTNKCMMARVGKMSQTNVSSNQIPEKSVEMNGRVNLGFERDAVSDLDTRRKQGSRRNESKIRTISHGSIDVDVRSRGDVFYATPLTQWDCY